MRAELKRLLAILWHGKTGREVACEIAIGLAVWAAMYVLACGFLLLAPAL